jgi:hypothetical protein
MMGLIAPYTKICIVQEIRHRWRVSFFCFSGTRLYSRVNMHISSSGLAMGGLGYFYVSVKNAMGDYVRDKTITTDRAVVI